MLELISYTIVFIIAYKIGKHQTKNKLLKILTLGRDAAVNKIVLDVKRKYEKS